MVILLVFHAGDPGLIPVEGNIFRLPIFSILYIYCKKSLVAFYIKFNALANSSHQPLFINFQVQTHCQSYGYKYAVMSDILISKLFNKIHSITICANAHWHLVLLRSHFAKFVQPVFEVKVSNIPHSISLLILKAGYHVFSGVLCRNAWNSAIHLFMIRFTGMLAYLDIQTELQDCLYEYCLKAKWYKLELLVLQCTCTTQWLHKGIFWLSMRK